MAFIDSCGLMLEPQEGMTVGEIIDWANYAEESGYGYIFRSDHVLPTSGKPGLSSPECWVTLGAIAAATRKVKFGPMVSPIGFRNPAMLAKMACTLHSFSNGRLVLAVGAGWYQKEYEAHGIRFPDVRERKDQFHEALQIIRPITQGEHATFKGNYFSADTEWAPKLEPKMHLVVGGRDSQIIGWAGEFADELNLFSPPSKILEKAKRILKKKIELSQMSPFLIAESEDALYSKVRAFLERHGGAEKGAGFNKDAIKAQISKFIEAGMPCGVVEDFVAQIEEKRKSGLGKFYFQLQNPKDKEMVELLTRTLRRM
jgi:alkanesulfonate monooxygenase SsuD/methylene tetrahydromethanopterin reductase-like flavin-dependent oxidoreductase (luciferase family)